ncbi:hypothetical protein MNBD_GAMMA06-969 [hydrothermal vent metagenome]|uniref:DUF4258 domain-containing protein n=1 Tax=hydrothermal vent metagenome TaxID=652676 RepID=A0A3B0WI30_9ZZZZ
MTSDNIIRFRRLSRDQAEILIHEISRDSKRVVLSRHAKERMIERRVTFKEVIVCLDRFTFFEEPSWSTTHHGGYRMTIEARSTDHYLRIGLSLNNDTDAEDGEDNYILIITVIDI